MKKLIVLSLMLGGTMMTTKAQNLPQKSPRGKVEQIVGLTNVTIDYSRPSVRDREIFGGLLPYDEMWRTGANARTTIAFEDPIMIDGEKLEPGKYAILTIPHEDNWTVIFSNNTESWGKNDYDEANDVMRFEKEINSHSDVTETFTFQFEKYHDSTFMLTMDWENSEVIFEVKGYVNKKAWANIEKALEKKPEDAGVLRDAVGYAASSGQRLDEAKEWLAKSKEIETTWYTHVTEARLMAAMENYKKAKKSMKRAIQMGQKAAEEKGEEFNYEENLVEEMESWG